MAKAGEGEMRFSQLCNHLTSVCISVLERIPGKRQLPCPGQPFEAAIIPKEESQALRY